MLHEIAQGESFANRLARVLIATRIQHDDLLWHQECCQRDVLRDDQVAGFSVVHDVPVGDIGTAIDPDGGDVPVPRGRLQPLIRHEHGGNLESLGGAEDNILNIARGRVGIDPDLQGCLSANGGGGGGCERARGELRQSGRRDHNCERARDTDVGIGGIEPLVRRMRLTSVATGADGDGGNPQADGYIGVR